MPETVRLFVGVSANNEDLEAQAVLEYTARKYCSLPLEITWMRQAEKGTWSGWACSSGRTPFTHFRWSVPAACKFEGKAIYTDVDFFFVADLAELWLQNVPNVALVRNATGKLSTSCIVWDCQKAKAVLPTLDALRSMTDAHGFCLNYFRQNPQLLAAFVGNWDCADLKGTTLSDPNVKAVHFTRIETQLHLPYALKRLKAEGGQHWYTGEVFEHPSAELVKRYGELLREAQEAGFTVDMFRVKPFSDATRRDFAYKQHVGKQR